MVIRSGTDLISLLISLLLLLLFLFKKSRLIEVTHVQETCTRNLHRCT